MPLDPQAQMLLDMMAASGAPPATEQTVEMAREGYRAVVGLAGPPAEVHAVTDITVAGRPARVYRPSEGTLPVVAWFHGGGFVIGDLDTHDHVCRELAARSGAIVVAIDYRLAPAYPFPAAVDDCFAALGWLAANGAELGADTSRLAVAGDSAGANLAAVVAIKARDEGAPPLRFQLLVYPRTYPGYDTKSHVDNGQGYVLTRELMDWFEERYQPAADDWRAFPGLASSLANLPPALVVTAEFDPLRDEGEEYAKQLEAAGVAAKASRYEGQIHLFFQLPGFFPGGARAVDEAAAALRDALS